MQFFAFKKCTSGHPEDTITITLQLLPYPLMQYLPLNPQVDVHCQFVDH